MANFQDRLAALSGQQAAQQAMPQGAPAAPQAPKSSLSEEELTEADKLIAKYSATDYKNDPVGAQVREEEWTVEDSLAAAQRFFSGMAMGWGDEAGIMVAAASAKFIDGADYGETYDEMKRAYDDEQARFAEEHSGAALAADLTGAIASPLNYMGAGAGAKALQGTRLGPITVGAKTAGTAAQIGRAGVEGAIYGAGEATPGSRLEGAATGAAFGAGGAAVLGGAGAL